MQYHDNNWKGIATYNEVYHYISTMGRIEGYLHTDYKVCNQPWYHGNPVKGWHNWVKATIKGETVLCQIIFF